MGCAGGTDGIGLAGIPTDARVSDSADTDVTSGGTRSSFSNIAESDLEGFLFFRKLPTVPLVFSLLT